MNRINLELLQQKFFGITFFLVDACTVLNSNTHTLLLLLIILIFGAFGGYLNYLHNFDIAESKQDESKQDKRKYVLLGVGSAILVPAFFRMIASDLVKFVEPFDTNNYLIFAGFCLVAAIFSRRFIKTIGDKILDTVKKAEINSKEVREEIKTTKLELHSTQERIEDVKASVNLHGIHQVSAESFTSTNDDELLELVDSFIERTSLPDYSDRLKMKAELGRKMGQLIVRNKLSKNELLRKHPKEGMYLALAYAIELSPEADSLDLLGKIANRANQLYTKYVILIAYRTLASSGFIPQDMVREVVSIVERFREKADRPLTRNIDDTLNVLRFIDSTI